MRSLRVGFTTARWRNFVFSSTKQILIDFFSYKDIVCDKLNQKCFLFRMNGSIKQNQKISHLFRPYI